VEEFFSGRRVCLNPLWVGGQDGQAIKNGLFKPISDTVLVAIGTYKFGWDFCERG
jgi:hypothetical protein